MKLNNNNLDVFLSGTEITNKVKTFGEAYSLNMTTLNYLEIGYRKPFNQMFIEIKTPNTNTSTLIVERWNGSAWVALNFVDETEGLKKSGFVFFDETDKTVNQTLNGKNQSWLRIKVSFATAGLILNGLNLVFSNLQDLKNEEPAVETFYPRGITSHIFSLTAARDYILRRINNSQPMNYYTGNGLNSTSYVHIRDLNVWDIFDVNQLRDASTYYTLHKIYSNRSDEAGDVYREKADYYKELFESTFKLWTGRYLVLDMEDDGKEDDLDKFMGLKTITITR